MRHSTEVTGRGQGRARMQRLTNQGNRAAVAPQTVGGRKAHPPKAEKNFDKKLNRKESAKARRSALAALAVRDLIEERGHELDNDSLTFPIVVEKGIEDLEKTSEAVELLKNLGVYKDIERAKAGKNIRAGKGKNRNRKYFRPASILVILPEDASGRRAFSNLAGSTVKTPSTLTVEDLAPGGEVGRLTLFSVKALNDLKRWQS
jgi:large subunit ribosomal protein L4e